MPKFSTPPYAPLPPHDILTPTEIAAYLRVSNQTVYALIHDGALPVAIIRGQYRVRREDFEAWARQAFPTYRAELVEKRLEKIIQPDLFARSN